MFGVEEYTKEQLKRASDELLKELEVEDPEASPPKPTNDEILEMFEYCSSETGVKGSDTTVSTTTDNITTEGAETPAGHDHDRSDVWNTPEDRIAGLARFLDGYYRYVDSKWQGIPSDDYFAKVMAVKFVPDENGFAKRASDPSVPVKFHWYKVSDSAERAKMARQIIKGNDKGWQMYFTNNVTLTNKGNGSEKDIALVLSTVTDIDCASKARPNSEGKVQAPDPETAVGWLPCQPTFIIRTGHGIQAFNVFSDPQVPTDVDIKGLNKDYIRAIQQAAVSDSVNAGIDPVESPWHYFRCPYTYNYRDGLNQNHLATVDDLNGCYWQYDEFKAKVEESLTIEVQATTTTAEKQEKGRAGDTPVSTDHKPTVADSIKGFTDNVHAPDPPELQDIMIRQALAAMHDQAIDYNLWLAINTAGNNLGFTAEVDALNYSDPRESKYETPDEVYKRKLSTDSRFGYDTIIGIATKYYGFNPDNTVRKDFWTPEKKKQYKGTEYQWWGRRHKDNGSDNDNSVTGHGSLTPDYLLGGEATDRQNALRLYYYSKGLVRYIPETDEFAVWEETVVKETGEVGGCWRITSKTQYIATRLEEMVRDLAPLASTDDEYKIIRALENDRKVKAAISSFKRLREVHIKYSKFDQHPHLLNVLNGTINLETGSIVPANPDDYLSQQAPVIFDPLADSKTFLDFMTSILPDEDDRRGELRWNGYCLTGEVREHKAHFVWGSGANGKTTLTKAMRALLGDGENSNGYATSYNIKALLQNRTQKDGNEATPERAKLVGKRYVVCDEIPKQKQLDDAEFKALTGGDAISYRRLHCDAQTCENPQHKFVLFGQQLPGLDDPSDQGVLRRLQVIQFTQDFRANPDTGLVERLTTPEALSGMLNVLVQEAVAYYKDGLYESAEMRVARESYVAENDYVRRFMDNAVELAEGSNLTLQEIVAEMHKQEEDSWTAGDKWIAKRLRDLGYTVVRRNIGNVVVGIRWKRDQQ